MIDKTKQMAPNTPAPRTVSAQDAIKMFNTVENAVLDLAAFVDVNDAGADGGNQQRMTGQNTEIAFGTGHHDHLHRL